jgi:hypothetical protein
MNFRKLTWACSTRDSKPGAWRASFEFRGLAGRLAHELLIPALGQDPYGPVKDGIEEAIAAHEWEMWDSGEADGDFEASWERKRLAGWCIVDLGETEATDGVGEGNEG